MMTVLMMLSPVSAQTQMSLEEVSVKLNKDLPENYDQVTRLRKTTVENNHLIYNFLLNADQAEFDRALPKVKAQVMKTICSKPREKQILKGHKASIVYRYENLKGQSLGEFMIAPSHCQ